MSYCRLGFEGALKGLDLRNVALSAGAANILSLLEQLDPKRPQSPTPACESPLLKARKWEPHFMIRLIIYIYMYIYIHYIYIYTPNQLRKGR